MKKLTIRLEDYIHDRLNLVSKDNKTSINKTVEIILKEYIDNPKEINYLDEIDKKLKIIDEKIEKISKRQYKHFKLSQQHFANFGYLSNADINEDKCLKETLGKDKFNE